MRMFALLPAIVLASMLTAPVAQVALADPPAQQASTAHSSDSSAAPSTGPYSNDSYMSPPVGD